MGEQKGLKLIEDPTEVKRDPRYRKQNDLKESIEGFLLSNLYLKIQDHHS